jgi:hypothetical protein
MPSNNPPTWLDLVTAINAPSLSTATGETGVAAVVWGRGVGVLGAAFVAIWGAGSVATAVAAAPTTLVSATTSIAPGVETTSVLSQPINKNNPQSKLKTTLCICLIICSNRTYHKDLGDWGQESEQLLISITGK